MLDKSLKSVRHAGLICCLLLSAGCTTTIKVSGEIPAPLVPKLPLTGVMVYAENFRNYQYAEKEKDRSLKSIDFGQSQVTLFDSIFSRVLNLSAETGEQIDLRIEPELLDFQYSVPRETKLKLYEVWLKYRVRISDVNDEELADWVVKGYGKTPTAMLTSASLAFNLATNIALRDVGAQLAIGFPRQKAIEELLNDNGGQKLASEQPLPESTSDNEQESN